MYFPLISALVCSFDICNLASLSAYNCLTLDSVVEFSADVRQPWTNLHDLYFKYLIIRFDYLIIPFDYSIIG